MPDIDPLGEEDWGYVQESLEEKPKIGDTVKIKSVSSVYKKISYEKGGDGIGEITDIRSDLYSIYRIIWK